MTGWKVSSSAAPATMNAPRMMTSAPDDAEHENPVLIAERDRERREDNGEHEHVVQRQALLDQVAGQIRLAGAAALLGPQQDAEPSPIATHTALQTPASLSDTS
jgi:hypothetical protein